MSEPYYDPSDRPDDDLTRDDFEGAMAAPLHTPLPWRVGKTGCVVADVPVPGLQGSDDTDYYGGHLICESVTPSNAEFIVRACNSHQPLLDVVRRCEMWFSTAPEGRAMQLVCQAAIEKVNGKGGA